MCGKGGFFPFFFTMCQGQQYTSSLVSLSRGNPASSAAKEISMEPSTLAALPQLPTVI